MSDSFQSYVFAELGASGRGGFGRVKDWLIGEKVIEEKVTAGGRGENEHLPGAHASSILVQDNDQWRSLSDKGVIFDVGQIIEASTDLQSGQCPDCNNDFPVGSAAFSVIDEALGRFSEGGSGVMICPHCGRDSHLASWDFGGAMAVGIAKVTFWNWPQHEPDLVARFRKLSGMWCTEVWGKL